MTTIYERQQKYAYRVRNEKGDLEPWSGVFDSYSLAQRWHLKHGVRFEKQGHKLVLIKVGSDYKDK